MRKEISISDKLIKKYRNFLVEQEKSKSTINSYIREILALQIFLDDRALSKGILLSYKAMLTAQYSPSTCNVTISALNSFLRYIGREDLFVKPLRIQKQVFESQNKELSKKEYNKLVRAATINGDERTALAIQTICATGIRVSELQYITVEAIKSGQAHVSNRSEERR